MDDVKQLKKRIAELEHGLEPFARARSIHDALGISTDETAGARAFLPGAWPTMGDMKRALELVPRKKWKS